METIENEPTSEPESKPKRKYKKRLSKTDAEKAIIQLAVTHKYVKKDIFTALKSKECYPGTNARLAYLKALQQLEIDYVEQITKMGVLPKNVASQTTTEYKFKAHVGKGGSVQTMPVNNMQLHALERDEQKEYNEHVADSPEDQAIRAQLEAEFGDRAAQPEKEPRANEEAECSPT